MKRGNLILYDNTGRIFHQSGEAQGDILPHTYPVGIPYIEVPYGSTKGKRVVSVDVSEIPHKIVTEEIQTKPTYEELENQLLLNENSNVEGGIF